MENYSAPGGIKIETINLLNYNGTKQLEITSIVSEFNIYESIQKPFVTASFAINDGLSLITQFPIIGQETLNISFITANDAYLKNIEMNFRVISVQEMKRENIRQATYILNCVSPVMIQDLNTKIRKAYTNMPIDQMATSILSDYLGSDFQKVDPTEGNRTIIIPNLSPSNALKFLTRQAKSSEYKSSPYFFYQTCDGFYFRTSNDIINPAKKTRFSDGSSIDKYYAMDFDFSRGLLSPRETVSKTGYSGGSRGLSTKPYEYLKIKSFVFHNLGNYYSGFTSGYLENTVAFFDPVTGQYEEKKYSYLSDNEKFEKTTQSSQSDFLTNTNDYLNSGAGFVIFEPTNYNQLNTYPNDQNYDTLNDKIGSKNIFENVNVTVAIPGDSEKRAGTVIDLAFPEFGATDDIEGSLNKFVSGEYLILSVRHKYNSDGYETIINASKNAFEYKIEDAGPNFSTSLYDENNPQSTTNVDKG